MILIALGGGLGAIARYLVDRGTNALTHRWLRGNAIPWGTVLINVTGSFLLGFVAGWWMFHPWDPNGKLVLGLGFLGGYTTFSTASVEAARLILAGRGIAAAIQAVGMLVASVAAVGIGLWLSA